MRQKRGDSGKGRWRLRRGFSTLLLCVWTWSATATEHPSAAPTWKVNLKDADIAALVSEVAQITGKNFIVDPRVHGTVTVISSHGLSREQVYDLFQGVLDVNGFAAVPSGATIKIVPDINAKSSGVAVDLTGGQHGEAMQTRIVFLDNTSATDLVPVLRPMMPQFAHLAAVPAANALILSDRSANIAALMDIVHALDSTDDEEVVALPLHNAQVGDVLNMLQALTPISSTKDVHAFSRVHVVADERTNRLIVRGDAKSLMRIRALIATLDVPSQSVGNVEVFRLRHASAKEVSTVLKGMINGSGGGGGGGGGGAAAPAGAVGTAQSADKLSGPATVMADKDQNAVVVRASADVMREIEGVVRQLDVRRPEVLIQAAIVEITGSDGNELGVQWAAGNPNAGIGTISFSDAGTSINSVIADGLNNSPPASISDGITAGFGRYIKGANGSSSLWGFLVQALATASNANLLSAPSLLTLDNQEAKIVVGENVPFVTGASTSVVSGTNNPFQTIERKDVGITLKVIPHISEDEELRLEVDQEVSAVLPAVTGVHAADLITSTRNVKTTILAHNHQTIVLGGLMENDDTRSQSHIPWIGDIPGLGWLFRASGDNVTKRNLLIFLTPSIITDDAGVNSMTSKAYSQVRTFQLGLWPDHIGMLPDHMEDVYKGDTKDVLPLPPSQ